MLRPACWLISVKTGNGKVPVVMAGTAGLTMRKPAIRTTAMPTSGNSHRIQADFSRACIRVNGNNSADFEARKAAVVVEPATVQETPLTPKDCAEFIWAGAGPNQEVHLCFRLLSQISSASYSA